MAKNWPKLAKSYLSKLLTSYSHRMNNFEYHEVISNQILPNYLRVLMFGQLLAPIWPNLVQFGQIFSFWDTDFIFTQNEYLWKFWNIFKSNIARFIVCVHFWYNTWSNLAQFGPIWPNLAQFGSIWPNLALFVQVFSFQESDFIFKQNE